MSKFMLTDEEIRAARAKAERFAFYAGDMEIATAQVKKIADDLRQRADILDDTLVDKETVLYLRLIVEEYDPQPAKEEEK